MGIDTLGIWVGVGVVAAIGGISLIPEHARWAWFLIGSGIAVIVVSTTAFFTRGPRIYVSINDVLLKCIQEINRKYQSYSFTPSLKKTFFYMILTLAKEGEITLWGRLENNAERSMIPAASLASVSFPDEGGFDFIKVSTGDEYDRLALTKRGVRRTAGRAMQLAAQDMFLATQSNKPMGISDSSAWTGRSQ